MPEMVKKNGRCIFLSSNRCTIYENRPLICRFYPFIMFKTDDYVFKVDKHCEGVGLGKVVDERYFWELVQQAQNAMAKTS